MRRWVAARAILGTLLAAALGISPLLSAGAAAAAEVCAGITTESLGLANVRISRAELVGAGPDGPSHCRVEGVANERTGIDGRHYAIGFEMRLPTPDGWNGRFLHQLNGGNDGVVVPALGDPNNLNAVGGVSALARGFAVLSSDSGHDGKDPANAPEGLAQGNVFGLDPQARLDYGYAADLTLSPVAKTVIARFYGRAPDHSYAFGCSNGGRHVMVAAVRLAGAYDGFIAGDPGFNLPKAAIQHAWDVQDFEKADPDLRKSFSREDMRLISAKVLDACDALDGVQDGMVGDLKLCQRRFRLADLACTGEKIASCLTPQQVAALARAFGGPRDSAGHQLYATWPFDAGMGSENWRFWKLESPIAPWEHLPLIAIMGAGSLSYVFTTPPTRTDGTPQALLKFLESFDFDKDAPKIYARDGTYTESAMEFMTPPDAADPRLAELDRAGHKLIVYHGQSDGVFSVDDTIDWYDRLDRNNAGKAASFARLYLVPGMNHCAGGPSTDKFDMLGAMVDWVENGRVPDAITATVSDKNLELPADWSRNRTRPLCAYPAIARYQGGDKEHADSFVCSGP